MAASPKAKPTALFDLKSAALSVLALHLKTPDMAALVAALNARYDAEAGLFLHEPLCLDLTALREVADPLDLAALLPALRAHGFNPMAVRGGSALQHEQALQLGLIEAPEAAPGRTETPTEPTVPEVAATARPDAPAAEASAVPAAPVAGPGRTLIIDKPLRSGQQVYARGGDLIVMAVVNFGAEVIADGSIHVYAPLRGRALAGAQGDTSARIFAACMSPQLVSIAGTWRTFDGGLPPEVADKPAQVRLDGDKLLFDPLKF